MPEKESVKVCAWCGKILGPANPERAGLSHGICETCERILRKEIESYKHPECQTPNKRG